MNVAYDGNSERHDYKLQTFYDFIENCILKNLPVPVIDNKTICVILIIDDNIWFTSIQEAFPYNESSPFPIFNNYMCLKIKNTYVYLINKNNNIYGDDYNVSPLIRRYNLPLFPEICSGKLTKFSQSEINKWK